MKPAGSNSGLLPLRCGATRDSTRLRKWYRSAAPGNTKGHIKSPRTQKDKGSRVTVNETTIEATPQEVWDVLADGWLYPLWVVGATRMRAVDDGWPQVGTRIHHSAGVWPAVINDETVVLAAEPPKRIELRAKGWPMGEADVTIVVEPSVRGSRVVIEEDASIGPGRLMPSVIRQPLLSWRNTETLRRLKFVVEGRSAR